MPLLIVFGGLPGSGKTTIARELARRLSASYIRIDTIEQALKAAGLAVGATGYAIANALAAENLKLDRTVIADCVNPVLTSRQGWRETAQRHQAGLVEIETICGDLVEHRRRVESRVADIDGLVQPTWQEVKDRAYQPWDRDRLVLDTTAKSIGSLVEIAEAYIRACATRAV